MRQVGLGQAEDRRFFGRDRGRLVMGGILALAIGLVLLAGLTRLAGALEPDPTRQMASGGPERLLGMDEQALVRLLGQPAQRETLGADLRLSYAGELPFTLTLSGTQSLCSAVTVEGLALLGVEPEKPAAQARAALSQGGIHWLDNAFDPAYSGGGVRSPEVGWIAAYSGGYLYEFCYSREDPQQTIYSVRVGEGSLLEEPNNLFCAPQLSECLEGTDPVTLLGMTPEEVRARWGFTGSTLSLTAGYTDAGPGGLLSSEPSARCGSGETEVGYERTGDYGYTRSGRYLMLMTQSDQLPVLGLVPGTTTAQEAMDILTLQGGVECTLAAAPVLEEGAVYAQLDPTLLEAQGVDSDRQIYLTDRWYVELRFSDGVLSRAVFCLLEQTPDLTPPSTQEETSLEAAPLPEEGQPAVGQPEADPALAAEESGNAAVQGVPDQSGQGAGTSQPLQTPQWDGGTQTGSGQTQAGWRAYTVGGVTFSLLLPEGWDQRCVSVQSADSLTLYDAAVYQSQWGGVLLTIRCYGAGEDYAQTAYRVLAQTEQGTLVAVYPSQVQYDTGDGAAAQRYQQLSDTLADILDSMKLIG